MNRMIFEGLLKEREERIAVIRDAACRLHDSVGQTYDMTHPYGFHLQSVADFACRYGHLVCDRPEDVLTILFGAYYHDSMEDARLTYRAVLTVARDFLPADQAAAAAEIVYALTNEKGRTRAERANDKYYEGIRETPYAPFVKLCDRMANLSYSVHCPDGLNNRMARIYTEEMPHFLEALRSPHAAEDLRYVMPEEMVSDLLALII